MTDRSKFEAMLEALINEDQETAKELFHNIVVAKSREIYEELLESDFGAEEKPEEEDDSEEPADSEEGDIGGDATDDFASDVESDSEDEGDSEDSGEDEDVEDRVQDLEDALEDLKAEFEQLLAGEKNEEEQNPDVHGGELDGMEPDMGGEEEPMDMGMEPEVEDESMNGGKVIHHVHHDGGMQETFDADEQLIREYVEKVGLDWDNAANGAEGKSVGAQSGSVTGATNTKSTLDGSIKNDMGGTTSNIAQNGKANTTTFANQGQLKGDAVLKGSVVPNPDAKGNINVPGGKAGKTGFKTQVAGGHGTEKKGERPGKMAGAGTGEMGGQRGEQYARSPLNARK
jgi:hypothetical protein